MNTRNSWLSNFGSSSDIIDNTFYTREETISEVQENFNIRRFQSDEGYSVEVTNNVSSTPVIEQVLIQSHTNPINELKQDKKIHFTIDSVIRRGSYINWQNDIWLVVSRVDNVGGAYKSAQIQKTTQPFKWIDKYGVIRNYRCVVDNKLQDNSLDYNNNINLPDGKINVKVQLDEHTKEIRIDKRFLFGNRGKYTGYKITSIKDFIDENLVEYTMEYDPTNDASDDLINGIANVNQYNYTLVINSDSFEQQIGYSNNLSFTLTLNGQPSTEIIEWISSDSSIVSIDSSGNFECLAEGNATVTARMVNNPLISNSILIGVVSSPVGVKENRVSPQTFDIVQNKYITYEVYQFENNVANVSGFNFTLSGASSIKYTAEIINSNKIKITSKGYDSVKLNILATNLVDASTIIWQVQLKALW